MLCCLAPRRASTARHPEPAPIHHLFSSHLCQALPGPRQATEVTLLCGGVEGTKQVHRALPWGYLRPPHTKHKCNLLLMY